MLVQKTDEARLFNSDMVDATVLSDRPSNVERTSAKESVWISSGRPRYQIRSETSERRPQKVAYDVS